MEGGDRGRSSPDAPAGSAPPSPRPSAPAPPGYTLFRPWQVVGATFLGTLFAGFTLIAVNYHRLGRSRDVWATAGLAGLMSVLFVALILVLPGRLVTSWLVVLQCLVMLSVARTLQLRDIQRHHAAGGRKASSWAAIGLGCGWLAAVLAALVLVAAVFVVAAVLAR